MNSAYHELIILLTFNVILVFWLGEVGGETTGGEQVHEADRYITCVEMFGGANESNKQSVNNKILSRIGVFVCYRTSSW